MITGVTGRATIPIGAQEYTDIGIVSPLVAKLPRGTSDVIAPNSLA